MGNGMTIRQTMVGQSNTSGDMASQIRPSNEYTESWAVRVDEAVADPGGDRTTVRISSTSQKEYLQTLKNAIC